MRFGAANSGATVVIDPIDGSLNARRTLPSFSLSIAVASGRSMADVEVGYVYDFGSDEEFFARRGDGAQVNEEPLRAEGPGFGLEVVGLEGAKPERLIPVVGRASGQGVSAALRRLDRDHRSATWAAAASTRCSPVAPPARSTSAAGQLIAREAGAVVAFAGEGLDVSLDLDARYHIAAALDSEMLATVLEAQRFAEPAPEAAG